MNAASGPICPACVCCTPAPPEFCCPCYATPVEIQSKNRSPGNYLHKSCLYNGDQVSMFYYVVIYYQIYQRLIMNFCNWILFLSIDRLFGLEEMEISVVSMLIQSLLLWLGLVRVVKILLPSFFGGVAWLNVSCVSVSQKVMVKKKKKSVTILLWYNFIICCEIYQFLWDISYTLLFVSQVAKSKFSIKTKTESGLGVRWGGSSISCVRWFQLLVLILNW